MLLALKQVERVENRATHTNSDKHVKNDIKDFNILNYLLVFMRNKHIFNDEYSTL